MQYIPAYRLKDSMASVDFALTALLLFNVLVSEDVKW